MRVSPQDNSVHIGQRIAVVGNTGCGKTTLAKRLATRLDVPYVCNDEQIWGPNWTPVPHAQRVENFKRTLEGDRWTFDGNVQNRSDRPDDQYLLSRIDMIIWLDLPRIVAHWQLLRRTIWRAWSQEPLWHDNRESWRINFASRDSILLWGLCMHRRYRRIYRHLFNDPAVAHIAKIRLRSRAEIERLMQWLPPASTNDNENSGLC